jgi:hypothetical protein
MKTESIVKERYAASAKSREARLCCPVDYDAKYLASIPVEVIERLYTITNLPVSRFASWLKNINKLDDYMQLLIENFNPTTVNGLMCGNTINVSWRGEVFDCDFNQMLKMQWHDRDQPLSL